MTSDRWFFELDLDRTIRVVIANLDAGTVGIERDCLWQLVAPHIKSRYAPRGANAVYIARETFDKIVSGGAYRNFVYVK